jgi:hypothetical protein
MLVLDQLLQNVTTFYIIGIIKMKFANDIIEFVTEVRTSDAVRIDERLEKNIQTLEIIIICI